MQVKEWGAIYEAGSIAEHLADALAVVNAFDRLSKEGGNRNDLDL